MNENYNFFCDRVCSYIDHATDKEKRQIHKELSDHIEDHAQALIELGRSPEEAKAAAIVAMGDPEEIGREMNKQYPYIWLLISRIAAVIAVILALLLIDPIATHLGHAKDNLTARYAPMELYGEFQNPIDYRVELPDTGDIAYFFSMDIEENTDSRMGDYCAKIGLCIYDSNIFGRVTNHSNSFRFYMNVDEEHGDWLFTSGNGFKSSHVICSEHRVYISEGQETIYAKYQWRDDEIIIEIPIDWEATK